MTQAARAIPARPARDVRVDIVRGWLQLTIFASHANGSWIGAWLIHGTWGLSDSSEQFVFLSGLMLGSVFARKAIRQGWPAASRDMVLRTLRLYRTQLVVFALFGAMVILAGRSHLLPGEAERLGWGMLLAHPVRASLSALTMLYQPAYMDILPVFIWCMAMLPLFAWLEARIGDWALALPVALYAFTQWWGLMPPSLGGPNTYIGFNPFAWQLLFLGGAWLGRRVLLHGRALPRWDVLTVLAVLVVIAGLLLRLAWLGWLPWPAPVGEIDAVVNKNFLVWPRLVHALALAWLVGRFVPRQARWMDNALCRWLASAGRFSLQVFCLGLFLGWGTTAAFRLWPQAVWWLDLLLVPGGCAVLLAYGLWLDRQRDAVPAAMSTTVVPVPVRAVGDPGRSA